MTQTQELLEVNDTQQLDAIFDSPQAMPAPQIEDIFKDIDQEYADRRYDIHTEDARLQYGRAQENLSSIGQQYAQQKEDIISGRHSGEGVSVSNIITRLAIEQAEAAQEKRKEAVASWMRDDVAAIDEARQARCEQGPSKWFRKLGRAAIETDKFAGRMLVKGLKFLGRGAVAYGESQVPQYDQYEQQEASARQDQQKEPAELAKVPTVPVVELTTPAPEAFPAIPNQRNQYEDIVGYDDSDDLLDHLEDMGLTPKVC